MTIDEQQSVGGRFCPHCSDELPADHAAEQRVRCPSCRLIVGAARARPEPDGDTRPGRFRANEAKRVEAEATEPEEVMADLRTIAEELGCRVERLRLTDYERAVRDGAWVAPLSVVLATFTSWKAARRAAGGNPELDS